MIRTIVVTILGIVAQFQLTTVNAFCLDFAPGGYADRWEIQFDLAGNLYGTWSASSYAYPALARLPQLAPRLARFSSDRAR